MILRGRAHLFRNSPFMIKYRAYFRPSMRLLSSVVWSEGMYLAPHHFQAQNRYFEDSVQFATASLWRHAFGFTTLQIDADALRSGTVALLSARGIFEDG